MAELKTKPTKASVAAFLRGIEDAEKRKDCQTIAGMMRQATGSAPKMWGPSIVGYGNYRYRYASGREGDWFRVGVASNKAYISLYACAADERGYVAERYKKQLPKASIGKSCVRFKRLADLDTAALTALLKETAKTGFGM